MASALVIGIGSSGLAIIEQAQQFHYDITGKNKPGNNVEYVFLETDINRKASETASGKTDIHSLYVSLQANEAVIRNLKAQTGIDSDWMPESTTVLSKGDGAGGMSSFGRLSVWGQSNYGIVAEKIKQLYSNINGDERTQIYIIGTLTGGTGSGLAVDMGYLVREITKCNNVNAIFMIPNTSSFSQDKILHENSFGALMALDFYCNEKNNYKVNWPHGELNGNLKPPYNSIMILSQDFDGQKASMASPSELFKTAGMALTMNLMDIEKPNLETGFNSLLNARRVDQSGHDLRKQFFTAGMLLVQYPKAQLQELLAIDIIYDKLGNLINSEYFVDVNGEKKNIKNVESELKNSLREELERIISDARLDLNNVKGPDNADLNENIDICVNKILSNNTGKSSHDKYIYDLFSKETEGNFYISIKNNSSRSRDRIILEIEKLLASNITKYKNLNVAKILLESIGDHAKKQAEFFKKRYNIDGTDLTWDNELRKKVVPILKKCGKYKLIQQKKTYLKEQLIVLIELAKLNSILPKYQEITESILDGTSLITANGDITPNVPQITKIISTINNQLNGNNAGSLANRKIELESILNNKMSCFKMVFKKDNYLADFNEAQNTYKQSDKRITLEQMLESGNLWNTLKENQNIIKTALSTGLEFVRQSKFLGNTNISDIIKTLQPDLSHENKFISDLFKGNSFDIRKNLPAMIKVRSTHDQWHDHPKIPLCVVTNNYENLKNSVMNNFDFKEGDNTTNLPSLDNAVLFYQEYTFLGEENGRPKTFNPTLNLDYAENVKKHINMLLSEEFKKKRMPYLSVNQIKEYIS
jgi:hypothetical protein